MTKKMILTAVLSASLGMSATGCSTFRTLDAADNGSPKFFSGTRLNINAIQGNDVAMRKFNVEPPKYPVLDLPMSLVSDAVLAPLTGGAAFFESTGL